MDQQGRRDAREGRRRSRRRPRENRGRAPAPPSTPGPPGPAPVSLRPTSAEGPPPGWGAGKCAFRGLWSQAGCNEDALPGSPFCHAHRDQGPASDLQRKVFGWGCGGTIALVALVLVLSFFGLCGNGDGDCIDAHYDAFVDPYSDLDALQFFRENCGYDEYGFPEAR